MGSLADSQRKEENLKTGTGAKLFHDENSDVYVNTGMRDGQAPHSVFRMAPLSNRGPSQWLKPTKILCWHCAHKFKNPPIGIPTERQGGGTYLMRGNFCSFSCAKGFVIREGAYNSHVHLALIERMAREVYQCTDAIVPAPSPMALKAFGGTMTLTQFRSLKHVTLVHEPPFVSQRMLIESQRHSDSQPNDNAAVAASTSLLQAGMSTMNVRGLRCPDQPLQAKEILVNQHSSSQGTKLYAEFVEKKKSLEGNQDDDDAQKAVLDNGSQPCKPRGLINDFIA